MCPIQIVGLNSFVGFLAPEVKDNIGCENLLNNKKATKSSYLYGEGGKRENDFDLPVRLVSRVV